MMWLKGCPTCGGDLYTVSDMYGNYINCLQCGRTLTEREEAVLRLRAQRRGTAQPAVLRMREMVAAGRN